MNLVGYALGLLLAAKLIVRHIKGYKSERWAGQGLTGEADQPGRWGHHWSRAMNRVLACSTLAILAYTFASAANARASYRPAQLSFEYHEYLKWLPHSLHGPRSWYEFWGYLALACHFWAIRDWLLGKTATESNMALSGGDPHRGAVSGMPGRLRILLWTLAINGAALGIESMFQRIEGSGKLLFLVQPRVNPQAASQFGPYAYRGSAASYFNLVWPLIVGFWWTLIRTGNPQALDRTCCWYAPQSQRPAP
jgi:hypothetical protein